MDGCPDVGEIVFYDDDGSIHHEADTHDHNRGAEVWAASVHAAKAALVAFAQAALAFIRAASLTAGAHVEIRRGRSVLGGNLAGRRGHIRVVSRHESSLTLEDGTPALCRNCDLSLVCLWELEI